MDLNTIKKIGKNGKFIVLKKNNSIMNLSPITLGSKNK